MTTNYLEPSTHIVLIDPKAVGALAELRVAAINTASTVRERRAAVGSVIRLMCELGLIPKTWGKDVFITRGGDRLGHEWYALIHAPGPEGITVVES